MIISLEVAKLTPRGVLEVSGWAAGFSEVKTMDVILGDHIIGAPEFGRPRPDVRAAYPDFVNAENSGFFFQAEIDEGLFDTNEVTVKVTLKGGVIRSSTRAISQPAHIRRSRPSSEIFLNCEELSLLKDGAVHVKGWAAASDGVTEIEIQLDGEAIGAAKPGRPRPDVGNAYPAIASARTSGFVFDAKLAQPIAVGEHVVTLNVRTTVGGVRRAPYPVLVEDAPPEADAPESPDERIKFFVDSPALDNGVARSPVRGMLTVAGWAIARAGIDKITVFLDDTSIGAAFVGIRRPDINAAFPDWEGSLLAGYAITLPRAIFTADSHRVRLVVLDKHNLQRELEFRINVDLAEADSGAGAVPKRLRQSEIDLKRRLIESGPVKPAFTIGLIVGDQSPEERERARDTLKSLCEQCFPLFRVHFVTPGAMAQELNELAARLSIMVEPPLPDPLMVQKLSSWRVAQRSPFFMLLRAGDRLATHALLELALALGAEPDADFVYADELRYDHADKAVSAFHKPEWSPDLLLSSNYIGVPWCAATSVVEKADIRVDSLGVLGEYDLTLRLTECATAIRRAPLVLAERPRGVGDAPEQELVALSAAMRRRAIDGEILPGCIPGVHRLKRRVATVGMVSIIMPTIAARGLVETSIASIRNLSHYRNFEIVCIDNISDESSAWKPWLRTHADTVVEVLEPFNWSRFNNLGAAAARGEFLLFLNDDIEVLDPDWLEAMLEHAQQDDVGVVGPQLLYPDRRVQHAGLFLIDSGSRHAFRFAAEDEPGPFGLALSQRNVIAVTGACMMMRRSAFDAVGGFNEAHSIVNNDLDYCLRAWRAGKRVVFTPHTKLIHHELASRAKMQDVFDTSGFDADWRLRFLLGDPFYNPALSADGDNYSVETEPTSLVAAGHPILGRDQIKRILVQKLDHIGDFITALPAIRRLKVRFPQAEIHVLVPKASLSLTHLEPAIANAIEFNFFHAVSGLGHQEVTEEELVELRARLAPYAFDLAIDLRRHGETRHLLKCSGARMLAGFDHGGEHDWLDVTEEWEGDAPLVPKRAHVADELLGLIEAVSIACESDRTVIVGTATRKAAFDAMTTSITMAGITRGLFDRRYVCIHPAAGNSARQWPTSHFAGLIDLLIEYCNVNVALLGAEAEQEVAEEVFEQIARKDRVWSLVGKTGMRDVPTVIGASCLFVGNNSGPHHIAAALGVPTVGVHSSVVDAVEWGPLGPNSVAIRRQMSCGPCYLPSAADCHRRLACLRGLRPVEVFRQCRQFLSASLL